MKNFKRSVLICFLSLFLMSFIQKDTFAIIWTLDLTVAGTQEVPPNLSTATGNLTGTYDDVTNTLSFNLFFNGLTSGTTAAHFHGPAMPGFNAGVQIPLVLFPTGVLSGGYSNTYVLSASQENDLLGGLWYVNIHTTNFPGGEIRGQLTEGSLPVELTSLTSVINKNDVTLNWTTASEINNQEFAVERKVSESSDWVKVGTVTGNGNSTVANNYTYTERVSTGKYNYRLKQIDFNGNFEYFNLANEVNVGIPVEFELSQNYPNPFNPSTKIDYQIPTDANVNISIYDISGKEVINLVNEVKTAGYYTVQLNASNLSSGVYFYNLSSGSLNLTKKLTILK